MQIKLKNISFLMLTLTVVSGIQAQEDLFRLENGSISFESNAPLEVINARADALQGLINSEKRTFAFSISMNTFQGFNSPLQREHFNENYLESSKFPKATFVGKIIEDLNFEEDGDYIIRAKGILHIHGVDQERIIKSQLHKTGSTLTVESVFTVLLEDHNISIPKIVYQKIAEEIQVRIQATFEKK